MNNDDEILNIDGARRSKVPLVGVLFCTKKCLCGYFKTCKPTCNEDWMSEKGLL